MSYLEFTVLLYLIISYSNGVVSSLRVLVWGLGVLVLLLIAKVIRQTPVFTDCHDDMHIVQDEIFGPVMSILSYS